MTGKTPLMTIKAGQVSVAVWENDIPVNGKTVTVLKASVQRRYKDKNGEWQSSASFDRKEIPLAIYCLGKAFEAIIEEQNGSNSNNAEAVD